MDGKKAINITFQLKRKIGNDELLFTATSLAYSENARTAYNDLMGMVREAVLDYHDNIEPTIRNTSARAVQSTGDWHKVSKLTVSQLNGKRYVHALCGKWTKHGLTIWPNVAEIIGLHLDDVPDNGYTPKEPLFAFVATDGNGKPKIIELAIGKPRERD